MDPFAFYPLSVISALTFARDEHPSTDFKSLGEWRLLLIHGIANHMSAASQGY